MHYRNKDLAQRRQLLLLLSGKKKIFIEKLVHIEKKLTFRNQLLLLIKKLKYIMFRLNFINFLDTLKFQSHDFEKL